MKKRLQLGKEKNSRSSKVKIIAFILVLLTLSAISYGAPERNEQIKLVSTYPATVCPAIGNKVSSVASLTNSKIARRVIDGKTKRLSGGKSNLIGLSNDAILVEGNPGTALTFANSGWKSVVPCSISNGEQWFVGGSADLTGKSILFIINSGFSESAVDIEIYTPTGPIEAKSVSVPENSSKKISLDTLAPGEDKIVVAVKTKSGRVSSYLFDERKRGLKSLGSDFVAPVAKASKQITIAAVSGLSEKLISQNNSVNHTLRLLVPSSIDANVSVTINSNDGKFVPIGLSDVQVRGQFVLDLPLSFAPVNQSFSVIIDSDQPILASVLSRFTFGKSAEIAWAIGSDQLDKWSVNLSGSRPTLTFVGNRINVQISATGINGKKIEKKLTGLNFTSWRAPIGLNRLQITAKGDGISGGVLLLPEVGSIGISYIPMNNGANLETATEPISDAKVISRG